MNKLVTLFCIATTILMIPIAVVLDVRDQVWGMRHRA
jgi:hypothetical protein